MGKILTGMFLVTTVYLLVINQFENVSSTNGNSIAETHRPQRPRIDSRILPRRIAQYTRMKPEKFIEFIDDDDLFDLSKRQASDDYGHLRFGKRPEEQFDDYGHMRFGRSGAD